MSHLEHMSHTAATKVADAARGLSLKQFEDVVAQSLVRTGKNGKPGFVDPKAVYDEKVKRLNATGFLTVLQSDLTLEDVGGYGAFKEWLSVKKRSLGVEAREAGIPAPRGGLICGPPGTGKSLVCKMAASAMDLPLIRLDFGALFGGVVGESEANTRKAIETIEALAPCVCWVNH